MTKRMKRKREHKAPKSRPKKFIKTGDYQAGRELTRAPKQELKAFDVAITNQLFNTPGTAVVTTVNAVISGAELYQRVGRKLYMKSLHLRGFIQNTTGTAVQDVGRILVIYDSNPNGAAPTFANMFQDSNAGAATAGLSEINLFNRQRFKILRDYQVLLPSVTNTAGALSNFTQTNTIVNDFNVDLFVKLKGLEGVYNGTNGGTIADIQTGSVYVVTVCQATSGAWTFTWTTRLRYYD